METFTDNLGKKNIISAIRERKYATIHEVDCQFDLHFDVHDCNHYKSDGQYACPFDGFSISGDDNSWMTVNWGAVVEITFSDDYVNIVVDQNKLRKDVYDAG